LSRVVSKRHVAIIVVKLELDTWKDGHDVVVETDRAQVALAHLAPKKAFVYDLPCLVQKDLSEPLRLPHRVDRKLRNVRTRKRKFRVVHLYESDGTPVQKGNDEVALLVRVGLEPVFLSFLKYVVQVGGKVGGVLVVYFLFEVTVSEGIQENGTQGGHDVQVLRGYQLTCFESIFEKTAWHKRILTLKLNHKKVPFHLN